MLSLVYSLPVNFPFDWLGYVLLIVAFYCVIDLILGERCLVQCFSTDNRPFISAFFPLVRKA